MTPNAGLQHYLGMLRHDERMWRIVFAWVALGAVFLGVPAGASIPHRPAICIAMRPLDRDYPWIDSTIANLNSESFQDAKDQLLTDLRDVLKSSPSVTAQLRSAPLFVRKEFADDIIGWKSFRSALAHWLRRTRFGFSGRHNWDIRFRTTRWDPPRPTSSSRPT